MSVEESVEELVVHHPLKAVFILRKLKVGLMLELTITMEKSFSRQTRNMLNYLKSIKKSFEIKQKKQQLSNNFNSLPISKQPQALKKSYLLESLYYFFKAEVPAFRQLGEVRMGRKLRNCI